MGSARETAEAAFKKATTAKAVEPAVVAVNAKPILAKPVIPPAREMVTLRLERDVLDFFQAEGPGWQERIGKVLRKAAGL